MQEDTAVGRVYRNTAFTIQDDGTLIDRRTWAQGAPTPQCTKLAETLGQLQFGPDGCALDARGTSGRPTRSARAGCAWPPRAGLP